MKPGTAVFVWNGKKYSHVGLFVGDGIVIEAMGTVNGVTTTKVTASKWTHWGELTGVDYSATGTSSASDVIPTGAGGGVEGSPSVSAARPTLRKGSKGSAVKELQTMLLKLGYDLGPCGIDGDFGKSTDAAVRSFQSDHRLTVDGICGAATWAELEKAMTVLGNKGTVPAVLDPVGTEGLSPTFRVVISGLDLTQAKAIAANYPGNSEIERANL